ncbi:MAG: hypothetical protein ABIO70_20545 [Pseudomonadota bacterium]
MNTGCEDLLSPRPAWQAWLRAVALPVSIGFHVLVALFLISRPEPVRAAAQWVEMAVVKPPPVVEQPPPEPKPEPPRPKRERKPEAVSFKDTVPEPPPDAKEAPDADQEPQRVVRRVQGLSASSFAQGSGTGVSVRRGTTTGVAATDETMGLDEQAGFQLLPVATVTTQPRGCTRPPVEVPKEAIDAEYEGTLRMSLDLDDAGRVIGVRFLDHASYGVEDACEAAARAMRCRPARQGDTPVPVTGMPHRCTIKALD